MSPTKKKSKSIKRASLIEALLPIVILISLLFLNISIWGDESLGGPNQLALTFATAFAAANDTPQIAFAPRFALLCVPSSSIINKSSAA